MAQTIIDVVLVKSAWTDINTASSIVVGTKIDIQNKGSVPILLYEGTTAPSLSETSGRVLMTVNESNNIAIITAGSEKIWGLALGDGNIPVNVQER